MDRRGFIGAALAALAVAGCSSSEENESDVSPSADSKTSAELTLAYWDKNQTKTIEQNLKSFAKKYPNIKIKTNLAGFKAVSYTHLRAHET